MQQAPGPYPYPQAPAPKKGMSTVAKVFIGVGVLTALMFGGCAVLFVVGAAAGADAAAKGEKVKADKLATAATTLPWVGTVQANCEAYRAAPNQIKKSDIFRSNESTLESASVNSARGKLVRLTTNQGGSELSLKIELDGVEFTTESLMEGIKRGSPIYEAASSMTEGQCVVFSAAKIRSSSLVEQSKVCDLEYFANFTSLASCP